MWKPQKLPKKRRKSQTGGDCRNNRNVGEQRKTGTWKILHKLTAEQVLDKSIVLFNYVYENKVAFEAGNEPVAKDASLNNQAQTVNCTIERHVSIKQKPT